MERLEEIEKELNTHYDMIRELKAKVFPLEKEKEQICGERMSELVGLCFVGRDKNCYMIVDVPRPPMTLMPSPTNFHQIPVYKIDKTSKEMTYETFFSRACDSENPKNILKREIIDFISPEIFRQEAIATLQDVFSKTFSQKRKEEKNG